ncbi:hypothetical protein ABW19_dt0208293 [Dactylella cylindrospora]|nr:hypothetical protein ABW19_dt0208293 [Dactylella cylindrospora]
MPITLRHITGDSTWLITLTSPHNPPSHAPYIILLDPWIEGPSPVWHPKFAQNHHTVPSSISNLSELNPQPNLLLISQTKTDHCNEATCRQLPKQGVKVYAVPGADTIVRSWKHFDPRDVHMLRPFTSRKTGRVSRIPIYKDGSGPSDSTHDGHRRGPNYSFESDPNVAAVLELAFLPALRPWEIPSLHIALGISYTPTTDSPADLPPSPPLTPPSASLLLPMTLPSTSTSTLSIVSSHQSTSTPLASPVSAFSTATSSSKPPLSPRNPNQASTRKISAGKTDANLKLPGPKSSLTESILYTPHGVPPSALTQYLKSMPLPLTAFLHCFVRVDNPKWLGGTVSSGAPNAFKIISDMKSVRLAQARSKEQTRNSTGKPPPVEFGLGVKYLVATHDEEVEMEGFCSHFVKKRKFEFGEIEEALRGIAGKGLAGEKVDNSKREKEEGWKGPAGVTLLDLEVGEEAVLM